MKGEDWRKRARTLYEQAVFGGDARAVAAAEEELDGVEADLALARGRILHARFLEDGREDERERALFERAVELYRALGNPRGESEALFWVGTFHQVIRHDNDAAAPALERSYDLAVQVGDKLTQSYAVRHLGFAEMAAGRTSSARERFEESVRLRREIGFLPGVAAGLVALAYVAAEEGRRDDALIHLEEAASIANASDALGIIRWVEAAQKQL